MPTSGSSQLFLNSPSGNYAAFLVRQETPIGGGDIGSDFCYILVQKAGHSIWESECTSVSNVNTCTLVFSDAGLEIFDGNHSAWDTGADEEHLQTLDLLDGGDMEIRDQDGKLVWKASDDPLANQNCGFTGASGLALGHAPFSSNDQPLSGYNQPFSYNNKPFGANNQQGLVDNIAIDSGISGEKKFNFGVTLISLISLMAAFRSWLPRFPLFPLHFSVQNSPSTLHHRRPTCVRFRSSTPRVSASCASAEKARIHIASPASLYEVLGIQMGATCQEIKGAYRRLARVLHPDVASNGQKDTSADEFMKVHAAYATLSDPQKRADYDRTLFMWRKQLSSQFAMSSSSTVAMSSRFSGYKRPTWETDQCW
ncbi:hypothetical protein F0562_027121 [Nyssa sinensis]|uniref:J domain-containing protein n=1 Tax=Nyssa sinensis TaxID=561372 RepID=A0A5J5B2P8_9ASTE|nr:hypothetical protein F0562_027121 [Nyssa sinensis]